MKCISGYTGQFLCINKNCGEANSFVCSDPLDICKQNHQCCSLISLSYLLKKSRNEINGANPQKSRNKNEMLYPLYEKAKSISGVISLALASQKVVKQINKLLQTDAPLTGQDKDKIAKFMNDRKIQNGAQDNLTYKIQKQLEEFQTLINQFNHTMKQIRNKEIDDLKKKLDHQQKAKNLPMPIQSRIVDQKVYNREKSKVRKNQEPHQKNGGSKVKEPKTPQDKLMHEGKDDSPIRNMKISGLSNLVREKNKQQLRPDGTELKKTKQPIIIGPSPVKSRVPEGAKSGLKLMGMGFEEKLSTILKHHVPKGPLHSKITNDVKTINSFFFDKFVDCKLLYRASQNDFLATKFHQCCDGHRETLTIILTQFDKIIGGYTPLPWKSGGGQWYQDQEQKSFIFNLTAGQRYPIVNKQKAIWCSRTFGPSFGHPDLQISDKAYFNSNSCANFPMCYNNGNYKNTPGSTQLFCGTKNGHFRIREWEVYQLTFK